MPRRQRERFQALFQAEIPEVRFSVDEILSSLLSGEFRDLPQRPAWAFLDSETLAFVRFDPSRPYIGMHFLFNHPDTPEQIIRDVLAHELLHLRHPAKEIAGRMVSHHPEFVEEQKRIIPTFNETFDWCLINFATGLKIDRERERTLVKLRPPRSAWRHVHRLSLGDMTRMRPPPAEPSQMELL